MFFHSEHCYLRHPLFAESHSFFLSRILLFITLILSSAHALAQTAGGEGNTKQANFAPAQLDFSGPVLITNVVELKLQGKSWRERLNIPDLDVYIDESGKRFVPLLRLLRLLEAEGSVEDNVVTFSVSKGMKAQLNIDTGQLRVDSDTSTFDVITGVSDLTGKAELFVPEDVIVHAFGVELSWSDLAYSYTLKTNRTLRIFEDAHKAQRRRRAIIRHLSSTLQETEATQLPQESRQLISIIDAGIRLDTRTIRSSESSTITSLRPNITLYGQLLRGNYYLQLTEEIRSSDGIVPKPLSWIEDGLWTYEANHNVMRVGDTVIGWSDLVVPSTTFTGVVVRGLYGAGPVDTRGNQFLKGSRFTFSAEKAFDGYAPLGSSVEIYVNNRLIDSTIVDNTDNAPAGQGRYEFIATDLLNRALNEVRIVVTEPDGTREELVKSIAGSNALLPAGRGAYAVGLGTKRTERNREAEIQGIMAGAGYYYGLTRDATFGLSLVTQDDFVPDFNQSSRQYLARRSYLGQTLTYRVMDNLLFRQEAALNYEHQSGDTAQAATLALDYVTESLLLSSYLFSYSEEYSNGTTAVADRQGYALFGAPTLGDDIRLAASFAQVKEKSGDRQEDYLATQAILPDAIANSTVRLRLDHVQNEGTPPSNNDDNKRTMYSFGLESDPWNRATLEIDLAWGDRIDPVSTNDLRYGINIPLIGFTPGYGARIKAEQFLGDYNRVSTTYRDYGDNAESIELSLGRSPRQAGRLDMTLRYRRDLRRADNNAEINIEYPFDSRRRYIIGMNANYSDLSNDIRYNLHLSARDLLFVDRGMIGRVGGTGYIRAETGGLKGFVYLDADADGHYDRGEPGIEEIKVVVDGYQKYTSGATGHFFVGRNIHQDEVVVELDETELPAIYTPTQGRQSARWDKYIFTRVNLGVAVLGSISGEVSVWQDGARQRPLPGVVVKAKQVGNDDIVSQSISDNNGVYYLGGLKPGEYELILEADSVPPALRLAKELPKVTLPVSLEPIDIENIDIPLFATQ